MQQPAPRKSSSAPTAKSGRLDSLFRALFGLKEGWYRQRDIGKNNYELGIRHFRDGHFSDAVFRFRLLTWLNPGYADAWYWLGRSLLRDDKRPEATQAFKKADSLKPEQEDTEYMLAVALGKNAPEAALPKRIPPLLVKEYFDAMAVEYAAVAEREQYRGHIAVADAARASAQAGRVDHIMLDLGAGTGLCGARLRDIAAHITGVDISPKMLELCMRLQDETGRKRYDALINREAVDFMQGAADASFDMVLAAGLVDYIGDLDVFLKQVSRILKPGGMLVMTASIKDGEGHAFDAQAELFRFSKPCLESLALQNRMTVVSCEETEIAMGQKMWICVFRK